MRELILNEFVKEVIGPRNGVNERIKENPLYEYLTGILSPLDKTYERDPDQESNMVIKEVTTNETEDNTEESTPIFSRHDTILDPRTRPRSMGLSFQLKSPKNEDVIDICLTWARYLKDKNEWARKPRSFIKRGLKITDDKTIYIDSKSKITKKEKAEISLHIIKRPLVNGASHISIFLVNELEKKENKNKTSFHIFQPQIRINCVNGTIISFDTALGEDEEEKEDYFVYRNNKFLARGHMCSAIWSDIDPERKSKEHSFNGLPFYWIDGEPLSGNYKELFSSPDIRTEFVPIYSISSRSYNWENKWGGKPELIAEKISETWNPIKIREALYPLIEGYEKWIIGLSEKSKKLTREEREIAEKIIGKSKEIASRIKSGIRIIERNSNVRLAFCFANKVMDLQYKWKRGSDKQLEWRVFQLAFFLMNIDSLSSENSNERDICDLLYVPTGAGKTEAYLAIAAFMLGLRRLKVKTNPSGIGVIMRYTLRLLTIQQFRRALGMITAAEFLRVMHENSKFGWRPKECENDNKFLWGINRFSIGLWVGGGVTPNRIIGMATRSRYICGGIERIKGDNRCNKEDGEPAQILNCPVCNNILSVPDSGLSSGTHTLHVLASITPNKQAKYDKITRRHTDYKIGEKTTLNEIKFSNTNEEQITVSIKLTTKTRMTSNKIDNIWNKISDILVSEGLDVRLVSTRVSRPGYFILSKENRRGTLEPYNFEIFCTNPKCQLNHDAIWFEGRPSGLNQKKTIRIDGKEYEQNSKLNFIKVPYFHKKDNEYLSSRIPLNALTTDEQVYSFPPSFLLGTVDKIARIPFEPRSGVLFGNVDKYHPIYGYYREGCPPLSKLFRSGDQPKDKNMSIEIDKLNPPDLIIQDELHLIEGPLGSMVGIYETAIDFLSSFGKKVKYIASTATVKEAKSQVKCIFTRNVNQFPSVGLDANDKFFLRYAGKHPLEEEGPGKLYVGLCAPGIGLLTTEHRLWARLLQSVYELSKKHGNDIDNYWTLVGYFNSIRELAGAVSIYRQDIPQRMGKISDDPRYIPDDEDRKIELSGRKDSTDLPQTLSLLEKRFSGDVKNPQTADSLFTTSMFGTGVDISRLGLMIVHGQPKTTSSYIQSTGRIGRKRGGLIITFYRPTMPRDMSHYEMFCGYHMNMNRYVEPVTVAPFSPGTLERCAGPVLVGILRNMRNPTTKWQMNDSAPLMKDRKNDKEVSELKDIFENRSQNQHTSRKPPKDSVRNFIVSQIERWNSHAHRESNLKYNEYIIARKPVVLGDSIHLYENYSVVYKNVPPSLRDIEETTGFET